jgi:serine/threonine protein kinase
MKPQKIIAPTMQMQREFICKGSTGDIFMVRDGSTLVAMKLLDSRKATRHISSIDMIFKREVRALKAVSHRNIVALISAEQISPSEFVIMMTYCPGGSLFSFLYKSLGRSLTVKQIKKILGDIVNAVFHLHVRTVPIIHGDLKSLNILLMAPINSEKVIPWIKLCDFGSSKFADDPPAVGTLTVGTTQWMAPEVLSGGKYGPPSDIYSLGMLMFELCFREIPFAGLHENVVVARILKGERPHVSLRHLHSQGLSELGTILLACWDEKASSRPTIEVLIDRLSGEFILSDFPREAVMSVP